MTSKCQFPSDRQPFNTKRPSTVSTTTRTQTPATFSIRPAPIKNSRRPRTAATQTAKASSQLAIARSLPLSLKKPTRYTSQSSSTPQTNEPERTGHETGQADHESDTHEEDQLGGVRRRRLRQRRGAQGVRRVREL